MASNTLDDGQTNTSILSTVHSNPTALTDLQCASDHSLDNNTDAFTNEFQPDEYAGINWMRLLGYHLPHLTLGRRRGPTWSHGYDIEQSKIGKQYWVCKICHKKKAYI